MTDAKIAVLPCAPAPCFVPSADARTATLRLMHFIDAAIAVRFSEKKTSIVRFAG